MTVRTSLWADRWPAIALQECIDEVEAAAPQDRAKVTLGLPCKDCAKSTSCLTAKRKELGSLMYAREFGTKPMTSESSLFPREMLDRYTDRVNECRRWWRRDELRSTV